MRPYIATYTYKYYKCIPKVSTRYTKQQNYTDFLVNFQTDKRETNDRIIILMIFFIY